MRKVWIDENAYTRFQILYNSIQGLTDFLMLLINKDHLKTGYEGLNRRLKCLQCKLQFPSATFTNLCMQVYLRLKNSYGVICGASIARNYEVQTRCQIPQPKRSHIESFIQFEN